jgi:hypothetical protein
VHPPADDNPTTPSYAPLWSIGSAIALTLAVPLVLYVISPEGPIREGDTVFSTGRHTVVLAHPMEHERAGYEATCILELRDSLIVVNRPADHVGVPFRARMQAKTGLQFPFCPPQAEVFVKPSQVIQKLNVVAELKADLAQFFRR